MIGSIVVQDIPADAPATVERCCQGGQSSEIGRRDGPWLERHESESRAYLP